MNLKVVYFVTTSGRRWGKGLTLSIAMEAAGIFTLKSKLRKGDVEAVISLALFKPETTDQELENLRQLIVADNMWGNPIFFNDESHQDHKTDTEMINRLFIGWACDDKSFMLGKK